MKKLAYENVYVLQPFNGWVKAHVRGIFSTLDDVFDYFGEDVTISDEHETIIGREALKKFVFGDDCSGTVIKVTTDASNFGGLLNIDGHSDYYYVSVARFY